MFYILYHDKDMVVELLLPGSRFHTTSITQPTHQVVELGHIMEVNDDHIGTLSSGYREDELIETYGMHTVEYYQNPWQD